MVAAAWLKWRNPPIARWLVTLFGAALAASGYLTWLLRGFAYL
jgi:hypothetical protein